MRATNLSSKSASVGLFAAIVTSLCCITPVFSLLAGIGGIAATFSWMEPFRPYFIALTIGLIGLAWYIKLKPRTQEEVSCSCDEVKKSSFIQSKKFLSLITIFVVLMLSFPGYAHVFYSNNNQGASLLVAQDSAKTNLIVLDVKGMTCAGCERHIENEVGLLTGVKTVNASYSKGSTTIEYLSDKIEEKEIIEAINKTGYKVVEKAKDQ